MRIGKLKKAGITLLSLFMVVGLFTSNVKTIEAADNVVKGTVENDNNITINMFDYHIGRNQDTNDKYKPSASPAYGALDERIQKTGVNGGINTNHAFKFTNNPDNMEKEYNKWTKSTATGHGYPYYGIVQSTLENGFPKLADNDLNDNQKSLAYLFNDDNVSGKTKILKNVNGLLTKNGSNYSFDSDKQYAELDINNKQIGLSTAIENLGVFYPFNSKESVQNLVDNHQVTQYAVGKGFEPNLVNHYFGMTLETDFLQPKEGMLNEKDPMVFEFSGDDDVWVFVDGKLVLDLGGIHDKVTGSINFATGDVTIKRSNNAVDENHSFNMYTGKTFDGEYNNQYKLFEKDTDFADYTSHSFKFFYLERGNGASNCKLDFNLVTIPAGSVVVSKEVTNTDDEVVNYSDVDYEFQILKKTGDEMSPLENATYEIFKNGSKTGTGTTDSEGIFKLKHEEIAIFSNSFLDNDIYQVTETGAYLDGYNISASVGTIYQIEDGQFKAGASTGPLFVSTHPSVKFTNKIEYTSTLTITKSIASNSVTLLDDKTFTINLKINGNEYNGSYYLNGSYQKNANGNIYLKKDDTIEIRGLPYGSSFEVTEEDSEEYTPTYKVTGDVYDKREVNKACGKVDGENAKVNIENAINQYRQTTVNVTKNWVDGNNSDRPSSINVQLYKNGTKCGDAVSINTNKNWQHTFDELDYYSLVDGQYVINKYTVNEVNVDDNYISEISKDGNNWTITNTLKASLTITKAINDVNDEDGDAIFTFKITNQDTREVMYRTLRLDESTKYGNVTIEGLKYGSTYTVEELNTIRYTASNEDYTDTTSNNYRIQENRKLSQQKNVVNFYNKLTYDKNFSHTDVVENSFTIDESGIVNVVPKKLKKEAD